MYIRRVAQKAKNNTKLFLDPVEQSFPQNWCSNPILELAGFGFGEVWGTLWCLLAGFGALLDGSWLILGSPGPALGTYLGALGHLLAGLGRLLDGFWVPGTPRALILEGLGTCWAGFWRVPGSHFRMVFAAHCALLPHAFFWMQ